MKIQRTALALALVLGFATLPAGYAATASSSAAAQIVAAIAISNNTGLQFGQVAPSASAGTVTVSTASVRSSLGGVTLGNAVAAGAASFAVTGAPSNTYSITLPSSILINDGGTNDMTVDSFVSNPNNVGTLSGGGTQTLLVGATLHVAANQATGSYTGSFDVTVAYN